MGKHNHRYLGYSDFISRVQNRIHKSATTISRHKRNKPSIKIVRKVCAIRGGSRFITKTGYRISTRVRQRKGLLQPILFGSQEGRGAEAHLKSKASKQICKISSIQDANSEVNYPSSATRRVVSENRLEGCVFPDTHTSSSQTVSKIFIGGKLLPISSPSFRSDIQSKGLHQSHGSVSCSSAQAADSNIHVSGRLANKGTEPKKSTHSSGSHNGGSTPSRVDPKLGKVCTYSCSENKLLGNGFQFNRGQSETYRRAVSVSLPDHCNGAKKQTGASQLLSKNTGPDDRMYRPGTMGKVANETNSVVPTVKMATARPTNREVGAGQCLSVPALEVVDGQKEFFPRSESEYSKCTNSVNHRRLQIGMGSAHRNTASQRPVGSVDSRKQTHKLAGNAGCFSCPKTFQANGSKSNSIVENRQLNSRSICQQTRRDKVCRPLFANLGSPARVQGQCSKVDSSTHSREKECYRRSPVKRSVDKAHGVDSTPRNSRSGVQKVGKTTHRSLCDSLKQKTSGILLTNTRPGSGGSRCPLNELERDSRIRLSTPHLNSQSTGEGGKRGLYNNPHSATLAPPKLVSSSAKTTDKSADKAARKRGLAVSKSGEDMASRPSCSQPGSMEVVKKRRLKKGFSKRTAFIMACSRRESTTGTYDARLKRYYSWCRERSIDPFTAPVTEIAEFLQNLYDVEKLSPKTIQGYRAAISVIHKEVDGVPIGQNRDLRELILGMSQLKPSKKSLVPNWNLPLVLNSLIKEPFEPMQSADMKFVTLKTVFLLAVASGRRVSEIHALSIDKHHWRRERDGISMITNPEFMAKK